MHAAGCYSLREHSHVHLLLEPCVSPTQSTSLVTYGNSAYQPSNQPYLD